MARRCARVRLRLRGDYVNGDSPNHTNHNTINRCKFTLLARPGKLPKMIEYSFGIWLNPSSALVLWKQRSCRSVVWIGVQINVWTHTTNIFQIILMISNIIIMSWPLGRGWTSLTVISSNSQFACNYCLWFFDAFCNLLITDYGMCDGATAPRRF